MNIYVALEAIGKRYMDQLQDVKNQLCENVSIRAPVLFIGCAVHLHTLWEMQNSLDSSC